LAFAIFSCKSDVSHNNLIGLDFEALSAIGPTKGAFIMGTADGDLEQN
jgi:hypothetical protein